jgi:predicted nucleic acid-binding protein
VSYLLDTNVLCELVTLRPDERVVAWYDRTEEEDLFISAVSIGEIRRGLELLDMGRRRQRLESWLEQELCPRFERRMIDVDQAIALSWGRVSASRQKIGRPISVMDGFIAATALRHDLALATRNISDFEHLGLTLINPWEI